MSSYRKHIALIALLLFSFMQIADLHAIDHDDDSHDHCVLCDFSSEKNEYSYLSTSTTTIPEFVVNIPTRMQQFYVVSHYFQNETSGLHNKAPPVTA